MGVGRGLVGRRQGVIKKGQTLQEGLVSLGADMQLGEAFCGTYYHTIFPDKNTYLAREQVGTFP